MTSFICNGNVKVSSQFRRILSIYESNRNTMHLDLSWIKKKMKISMETFNKIEKTYIEHKLKRDIYLIKIFELLVKKST